jgi:phage gp29-like protein
MNTSVTVISSERIERAVRQRFSPMPELSMDLISAHLNDFRIGELRSATRTWEAMIERDLDLATVAQKRFSDAARLEWEIHQTDDGPEATRHAAALRYAYDNLETTTVLDQDERGGVSTLIRQMLTAHAFRYSVHEMILRIDSIDAKQCSFELRHCPTWFFEARRGRLAFLADDHEIYGQPLEPGRWLTTVGLGLMRPCSIAYGIKHFPLRDWLLYCSRYGLPAVHGETTAAPNTKEFDAFVEALQEFASNWICATGVGTKINLIEAKGGGDLPFAAPVEMVNRGYAKAFRGGDLSTESRDGSAVGANPQNEERVALLEDDARLVSETLNGRFDEPLIKYLFGVRPKAWFQLLPPKRLDVDKDIKGAEFLVKHGVAVGHKTVRLRLGWPEPEEGDDLLEAPQPVMAQPEDSAPGQPPLRGLANERPDPFQARSTEQLAQAVAADLAPIRRRLAAIERITDPDIRRTRLESLLADMESLEADILSDPEAAKVLEGIQGAALATGLAARRSV